MSTRSATVSSWGAVGGLKTQINGWKTFSSSAFSCHRGSDGPWSAGSLGSQWTTTTWPHEVGHVDMLWLKPPACPSPGPTSWCVLAITCLCVELLQDGGEVLHPCGRGAGVVDTSGLFQPSSAATRTFWCLPLRHARLRFSLCVFW